MPHQCTNCGRAFADGSTEMLSGCPDCGGNKFQYAPDGSGADATGADEADAAPEPDPDPTASSPVSRAAETVRDWVSDDADEGTDAGEDTPWPDSGRRPADRSTAADEGAPASDPGGSTDRSGDPAASTDRTRPAGDLSDDGEDVAQADARSEVISPDELPSNSGSPASPSSADGAPAELDDPPDHGRVVSEPTEADRPSLDELREELNDQFESIKIVRPGQYELNLMELYDREEYIVSLQEDGRYVIDVPDSWRGDDEPGTE